MCNFYPCVLFESLLHVIDQESRVYSWNLGKIYPVHFLKFWSLPHFTLEISKFRKSEHGRFIPNFPLNMWLLVRIWFLLSVVNIFSKYAWVVPLKDKNGTTILNAFRTILNQSKSMAEISKNVYSDKVVEIINTAMHIIKPLKWIIVWKIMIKILNLKLVVVWEIDTPNWSAENFIIKKVKNAVPWTYVISDLKGEEIIGTFFFYVNKSKII